MDIYCSHSNPPDYCSLTATDSHHLPPPQSHHHATFFSDFPSIPSDEAAELEWLSQFIDDTTSFHSFPPPSHTVVPPIGSLLTTTTSFLADNTNTTTYYADHRIIHDNTVSDSSNSHHPIDYPKSSNRKSRSRREFANGRSEEAGEMRRRCSHCASEKTPQWRSGPLGPKTLCNACGVRFKSGRLVPEYRPAASPTFVLTQHSNSHRKVMELRRQKELLQQHHQQ